jgi:hypothetical protein
MKIISRAHQESYMLVDIARNQTEVKVSNTQISRFMQQTGLGSVEGLTFTGPNGEEFEITSTGMRSTRVYTMRRKT